MSRRDPMRGVLTTKCDHCGDTQQCRLVTVDDRYLWRCLGGCDEVKK